MARVGLLLVSALAFAVLVHHAQPSPAVVLKLPPGLGWANASAYLLVKNEAYPVLLIPYGCGKAGRVVSEASASGQCSGRVVAVLPYKIGVPLPPPHRVAAEYVYGGRRVVVAPAEIPTPVLPYLKAGDKAAYSIYICGNGSAYQLIAAYRVSGAKPAGTVTVEPAYFSGATATVQRGDVWIVERPRIDLPPSSTCKTRGVPGWICNGRRCIVSGSFTVPPLAKLYEVWGTVHALAPSRFTATLYVNGVAVVTDTVELGAGETLFLGARMIMPTVSGHSRYVELELKVKPIGRVKVVYNVHAYVVDEIAVNDTLLYRESINIIGPLSGDKEAKTYIAESGSLRLTLPVPRVFAERSANLTLHIEGSENRPRRIKVYVDNALVCQGVSSRDPATGRQGYKCSVSAPALASTLRRLIESGKPLSILVELNGSVPPHSWWLVDAPVLVTLSRASYYTPISAAAGEPYGEVGYPLDDMFSLGYLFDNEWIQLASAGNLSTLSAAAVLGGLIVGERLSHNVGFSRIVVGFWLKKPGCTTKGGGSESFLMGLDARIVVRYKGVGPGFGDVDVRFVNVRSSIEEALKKKAMEILGALIRLLTEIFESPGGEISIAGKKAHVTYLVRCFPASYAQDSHVVYTVSKVYRKECKAGNCVKGIEKAIINVKLVPGWFGPTIANTSSVEVYIDALPLWGKVSRRGDAYAVSVVGSTELCSIGPQGVIVCVRLPLSGSAKFP